MFCSECGKEINDKAVVCVHCGVPTAIGAPKGSSQSDAALRMMLPVGRSGYAIAAGYLALFSVLIVFAPFALIFGVLGVLDIKKKPEKHGLGRAWFGIIMGALGSVVLVAFVIRVLIVQAG